MKWIKCITCTMYILENDNMFYVPMLKFPCSTTPPSIAQQYWFCESTFHTIPEILACLFDMSKLMLVKSPGTHALQGLCTDWHTLCNYITLLNIPSRQELLLAHSLASLEKLCMEMYPVNSCTTKPEFSVMINTTGCTLVATCEKVLNFLPIQMTD